MKPGLENLRNRKFLGVAELAAEATAVLGQIGPSQERGTVTEFPDERTIRYYLSEGLLSPSQEKQGTASVFGYQHLLQLLVVKRLQAEHLPIRKIRELVAGRTERQLERLLGSDDEKQKPGNEALRYLESLLTKPRPDSQRSSLPQSMPSIAMSSAPPPPPSAPNAATWERIQIEPGLELHVRGDYALPDDAKTHSRIATRILEVLGLRGDRQRKKGK
jgi:DNA-binding transcriptional MerR regulator